LKVAKAGIAKGQQKSARLWRDTVRHYHTEARRKRSRAKKICTLFIV
jgi:hypothetical protein